MFGDMRVAYIGNFQSPHSTENDLHKTMISMGVEVDQVEEREVTEWSLLLTRLNRYDLIMWTRTASHSAQIPIELRRVMQINAYLMNIPTVGVHLDRWWGLRRQADLYNDPFFHCQYLFTADDHAPEWWVALGANHIWSPPAIAPHNAYKGQPRAKYRSEIAFVGAWEGYGHTEWSHRPELVKWLRRHYKSRVRFWPEQGQPRITSPELNDLYASVKIVIGDSCLVPEPSGEPWTHYCSDRVFETIGRGAFLIHPDVDGVTSGGGRKLKPGQHMVTWPLWDWDTLRHVIDHYLADDMGRLAIAAQGFEHVKAEHTYRNRLVKIFDHVLGGEWSLKPLFETERVGGSVF